MNDSADEYALTYRKPVEELVGEWITSTFGESLKDYTRPPCEGPHVHWAYNTTTEDN